VTPLRLVIEFSVIFLYDQEELEHLIQVYTLNITGCSTFTQPQTSKFCAQYAEKFTETQLFYFMQKKFKFSRNFKLAIIMKSTENYFINCGFIINNYGTKLFE